jgi:hypothetical protein
VRVLTNDLTKNLLRERDLRKHSSFLPFSLREKGAGDEG